ncbi:MAG TPA: molybdopterin dinucleotide binding domain-containing protein, partial [Actinomycetota bacterium]|nr:molybdopterin dinucleotide binding domain-containing protein [Actinomycetota bacterium]
HPALLPGGRRVGDDGERAEVEARWGTVPADAGRSTQAILEACANREVDVLFLVGIDPLRDLPHADLVRRALRNARHVVVQSLELGALEPFADAFLPAAAWVEREGHATDWEGRSQPFHPVRGPAGVSRADWEIFAGLADAMGRPLGFASLEALRAESAPLLERRAVSSRSTAWTGTGRPQRLGELTLLSYPLLVDEGRLSEGADELKAALGQEAFVEVHPEDADKRGLVDGGRATVTTEAGEAVLDVRVTEHLAPGSAFVPFNQPGLAANELLSGSFTTAVRIEPAAAVAEAGVAEGAA